MTRREIREHVFIMLFQSEFHEAEELADQNRLYFDEYMTKASAQEQAYIEEDTSTILTPLFAHDLSLLAYMYMGLMHMH